MVHYSKVVKGAAAYVEAEMVSKLRGTLPAWIMGAAAAFFADYAETHVRRVLNSEMAKAFGFVDGENVNVETAYNYILPQAKKGSATIPMPLGIPAITLTEADVESLYRHIMGA